MDHAELEQLIKRCQDGEQAAFNELLDTYGPKVYAYFYRVTGAQEQAEDLLQDLFVKLIEKIHLYKHQNKFEHWLFRIAANQARDRARKFASRGYTASINDDGGKDYDTLASQLPGETLPPESDLIMREEVDALQDALAQLPEFDREIIMLRHYSQMSFKDIAQECNIPLGTALAKVHRGLKELKRILQYECP